MGRGFFSGVLWGSLAAVAGLWLLSQTSDTVTRVTLPPEEVHDEAPQGAQLAQTDEQGPPPQAPAETAAPETDQAALPSAPEQSPKEAAPDAGPAPSQAPAASTPPSPRSVPTQDNDPSVEVATTAPEQTGDADTTLPAPASDPLPEAVEPPTAATAGSSLQSAGGVAVPIPPGAPTGAGADVVAAAPQSEEQRPDAAASQPARPALPASDKAPVATDFSNPQVVEPTLPDTVGTPPTEPDAQDDRPAMVTAQAPTAGVEQPGALANAEADRPVTVDTQIGSGPETDNPTDTQADNDTGTRTGDAEQPATEIGDGDNPDGETEMAQAPRAARVPVVRKAGEAVQQDRVGGFVRAGQGFRKDEPAEESTSADDGANDRTTTEPAPDTGDLPALQRYAVPFENPEGRPIMAIILLPDEAADPQVAALPFEVSFAVDASKPDATRRMAALRDAGREVVLIAPLPDRARPSDVEVAFQDYLSAVPEAVAVMDTENANFQSSRQVSSQVAQILAETGHGMITYSHGLNSATQVAEREGVPAALVFRVFDEGNRDGAAIKRFLDQAAFRAGLSDGVVLVGRNRPETVRALLEWSLGNRAQTVALAPVSAVLK